MYSTACCGMCVYACMLVCAYASVWYVGTRRTTRFLTNSRLCKRECTEMGDDDGACASACACVYPSFPSSSSSFLLSLFPSSFSLVFLSSPNTNKKEDIDTKNNINNNNKQAQISFLPFDPLSLFFALFPCYLVVFLLGFQWLIGLSPPFHLLTLSLL